MSDKPGREVAKDMRAVIAKLLAQGWRYKAPRNGHPALYAPDGKTIIRIAGTASDHRSRSNALADIRRAGGTV